MVDKRNSTRKNQSRCSRTAVLLTWNKWSPESARGD
jgi:hypothetical protein